MLHAVPFLDPHRSHCCFHLYPFSPTFTNCFQFAFGWSLWTSSELHNESSFLIKWVLLVVRCVCCAITMKQYVEVNMSLKSQTAVKQLLKILSSSCEGIIFMYLGIAAVVSTYQLDVAFIVGTVAACVVSRIVGKCFFFVL